MKKSNSTDRIIAALIALLVASIFIFAISSILTYFKTGAKKLNKYDAGISLLDEHNPKTTWLPDALNLGGEINPYVRESLQEAYIDAWGILHLSLKNQKDLGLRENFSDLKSQQIVESFTSSSKLIKEDLNHNLKLHFISKDKQVASLTDYAAIVKTSVLTENGIVEYFDTSDYKIILTLNDGKWRVNKFHRIPTDLSQFK